MREMREERERQDLTYQQTLDNESKVCEITQQKVTTPENTPRDASCASPSSINLETMQSEPDLQQKQQ